MPSRFLAIGATGVVGIRAIPLFVGAGHGVTAVGRSPEKRAQLERRDWFEKLDASVVAL